MDSVDSVSLPSALPHDERLPRYQRLRDEILEKIARGEWLPDQAIPTEAALTRQYGLAVGTVRKAIDALAAEGLLERVQGKGTFVRRPCFDASLFRFFRHLNRHGTQLVPEGRILSKTVRVAPESICATLQIREGGECIHLSRIRIVEKQVHLVEDIWLPLPRFEALRAVDKDDFGNLLYPFYETTCGQVIGSARETLTVERATQTSAMHLGIEEGDPVVVIERLALGFDKVPLEWRRSCGSARTFRYQIEIS